MYDHVTFKALADDLLCALVFVQSSTFLEAAGRLTQSWLTTALCRSHSVLAILTVTATATVTSLCHGTRKCCAGSHHICIVRVLFYYSVCPQTAAKCLKVCGRVY